MSQLSNSELNEYQTNANVTAMYPGRLGENSKGNKKLLEFLSKVWAVFDEYTNSSGKEITKVLENGMPLVGLIYTCMGLSGEIGELQEKLINYRQSLF